METGNNTPGMHGKQPELPEEIVMAGDKTTAQTKNKPNCNATMNVAATASECKKSQPRAIVEDKPRNNPIDPADFDYKGRFEPG